MLPSDRERSEQGERDLGIEPTDEGGKAAGPPRARGWRRRWPRWLPSPKVMLVVAILVAFGLLVYRLRGEVGTAFHRVTLAGLVWLPAALAAEAVSFLAYAEVQRRLLIAGGAHLRHRTVASLTVAATGIANLVPGGTAPSSGWLVTQYRRYGVPLSLALWAVLAGGFVASVCIILILVVGALIAGLISLPVFFGLVALLVGVGVAGVLAAHHLPAVRRWLDRDRRLPGIRVARRVVRAVGDIGNFRAGFSGGVLVYALSVANWVLDVAVLAAGFAILNLPIPWKALLFAYAAAQMAGSLAPVPGGIGFVEGGMIGALTLAGTSAGAALVATVVYRLVTTLGMAGIGSLSLVYVHHRAPRTARLTGQAEALDRKARQERDGGDAHDGPSDAHDGPSDAHDGPSDAHDGGDAHDGPAAGPGPEEPSGPEVSRPGGRRGPG